MPTRDGYHGHVKVGLSKGNKKYFRKVHRLVLEAFVGPRPEGMECCHYNGDPADNRLENLRWDTSKGNTSDSIRHGTVRRGEEAATKLTESDVRAIRAAAGEHSLTQIASRFGISFSMAGRIIRRERWSHVED